MREILFRGKTVGGDWIIGLLSHVGNGWYISNKAGAPLAFDVIPSTVGQYTGLTDKNGVKIFEGDILQAHYDVDYPEDITTVVVIWHENGWYTTQCEYEYNPDQLEASDSDYCVVVGNIHYNPELLKVSE